MVDVAGGETVNGPEPDAVDGSVDSGKPQPGVRSSGVWLRGSAPGYAARRSEPYSSELLRDLFRPSEELTPPPRKPSAARAASAQPPAGAAIGSQAHPAIRKPQSEGSAPAPSEPGASREPGGRPCFLQLPRLDLLELPPELGVDLSNEPPNWQAFAAPEAPQRQARFPAAVFVVVALLAVLALVFFVLVR